MSIENGQPTNEQMSMLFTSQGEFCQTSNDLIMDFEEKLVSKENVAIILKLMQHTFRFLYPCYSNQITYEVVQNSEVSKQTPRRARVTLDSPFLLTKRDSLLQGAFWEKTAAGQSKNGFDKMCERICERRVKMH